MKKLYFLLLSVVLFSACDNSEGPEWCGLEQDANAAPQTLTILFIGNSHTFMNDIPGIIAQMAHSNGDSVYFEMSAPSGYDFQRHYVLEATISAIRSRKWDYIVLQESGWRTALIDEMLDTMVYPYADSLYHQIMENDASTDIVLYMTHGFKYGGDWCDLDPGVCAYEGMQARIRRTYLQLSRNLDVPLAPCGILWKIYRDTYHTDDLYQPDAFHANATGSYISACTLYSTIFHKNPTDLYIPAGVDQITGTQIQHLVSDVLFNCNPDWRSYWE